MNKGSFAENMYTKIDYMGWMLTKYMEILKYL